MDYLFAAYSVIFILIALYIVVLDRRQQKLNKEIVLLQEILKKN